ncbi:MAG: DUF3841 domain-containing protein [Clostridiaceae bacterium]
MEANKNSEKMVTLWTRQKIDSLKDLEKNGVIRITRKHLEEKFDIITDYFTELYDWFVIEASKKVPKPEGVTYPIWCSAREEYMLRPVADEVVFVVEIPESQVIYFDGSKWDLVLNHTYVPKDQEDAKAFSNLVVSKGLADGFSFLDKKTTHFYPAEAKMVRDSWIRVFDIDNWENDLFKIQANIWEIRPEMIKDIIYEDKK